VSAPTAAAALLAACLALVVLSVWLPIVGARRWAPAPRRAFTASVGAALGLALTTWLAVLSFTALSAG
jgi:hypothetical protein